MTVPFNWWQAGRGGACGWGGEVRVGGWGRWCMWLGGAAGAFWVGGGCVARSHPSLGRMSTPAYLPMSTERIILYKDPIGDKTGWHHLSFSKALDRRK